MKRVVKIAGMAVGVLGVVAAVGFGVASYKASVRLARTYKAHDVSVPVPYPLDASDPTPEAERPAVARERAISRGKHLVEARYSCNVCHGSDFAGGVMIDDPAIGSIRGPNITAGKGGRVDKYSISDWDRIVRHGIKPDGTPAVMPSEDFLRMSDRELSDVVAYITAQPAIDATVPAPAFGPVGKILLALGKFPISAEVVPDHLRAHMEQPPLSEESSAFGQHLAAICTGCHRANLAGGPMPFGPPGWPPASNLTQHQSGLAGWSFEDFEKTITTGVSKTGHTLRDPMTLLLLQARAMTAVERRALWKYLASVPARATNP